MGIEPTSSAWEAEVLPLNYTRREAKFYPSAAMSQCLPASMALTGQKWRLPEQPSEG